MFSSRERILEHRLKLDISRDSNCAEAMSEGRLWQKADSLVLFQRGQALYLSELLSAEA